MLRPERGLTSSRARLRLLAFGGTRGVLVWRWVVYEGEMGGEVGLPCLTFAAEMSFSSWGLALLTSSSGGAEYLVRIS